MTTFDVGVACVVFLVGALVSLGASAVLVANIERVAARLGLAEAILGLIAAIAADGPEISSATAALIRGQHSIGAGVVFGSNLFNLAALLGLSALIAGRVALHRSVVLFGGAMALWAAGVSVIAMVGAVTAPIALVLVLVVFIPYVVVSALSARRLGRLRLPRSWVRWLSHAVLDEETELRPALHPSAGGWRNAAAAGAALAVVIVASVGMEQAASDLGDHFAIPGIVVGGVVLAAVTSLPNAVAAVYLAVRGRARGAECGAQQQQRKCALRTADPVGDSGLSARFGRWCIDRRVVLGADRTLSCGGVPLARTRAHIGCAHRPRLSGLCRRGRRGGLGAR